VERWDQSGIRQDVSQGDLRMNDSSELYHATGTRLTWSSLLLLTYQLYWKRFWIFFLIALPPVLLAYCFKNAEHFLIQKLKHAGWLQISPHMTLPWLATALAITFATGAIYWSLSTLFFAAIAENVRESAADLNHEAFWDRIGPAMGCGRCCPSLDSHCRPALQVRTSDTSANGE